MNKVAAVNNSNFAYCTNIGLQNKYADNSLMEFVITDYNIWCNFSCLGDGKKQKLEKSRKRKNLAKDDVNNTEENTETACHETDSEQLMTNSTVCENMLSGAKPSNVEVVTFIDPLKKKKLSKAVEPGQKVRSPLSTKKLFLGGEGGFLIWIKMFI